MSGKDSKLTNAAMDYSEGRGAWILSGFGSALTAFWHVLNSDQILVANLTALFGIIFVGLRTLLLIVRFIYERWDIDYERAEKKAAAARAELEKEQRKLAESAERLANLQKEESFKNALKQNAVDNEKAVSDLPDRLKKSKSTL